MSATTRVVVASCAVAGLLGAGGWLVSKPAADDAAKAASSRLPSLGPKAAAVPPSQSAPEPGAMPPIHRQGDGAAREPVVEAAPVDYGVEPPEAPPLHPPDGYALAPAPVRPTSVDMAKSSPIPEYSAAGIPWLTAPDAANEVVRQARAAGRNWALGWVRLAANARTADAKAAIRRLGGEVLGVSGSLMRSRLPADGARLDAIRALPFVSGMGIAPPASKLRTFGDEGPTAGPLPVFITLMMDDPEGRWGDALVALGAVVERFDPALRMYVAKVDAGALAAVAAADFVAAVEPIDTVRASHDTATPTVGAAAVRRYLGVPGRFSGFGGAGVPIGVMDSGLNVNHRDIATGRASICAANFVSVPPRRGELDLWVDRSGHGTHVTGTFVGSGRADAQYTGVAPLVRHIRFAKVLDQEGSGRRDHVLSGMEWLAAPSGCDVGGRASARVKPLVVNVSLAAASRRFEARSSAERKLDSIIWNHRQLYVVAQANVGAQGFSNLAGAKNSLAVGATDDGGDIAAFSSWGPTADGRLAPSIVAAGTDVISASGWGRRTGHRPSSGTSMSAPMVAGVAALLLDAHPEHAEQPALARARLLATAIRPDAWLAAPQAFPLTNTNGPGPLHAQYGLGKASARTALLDRDGADGWRSGSAILAPREGAYSYVDVEVPADASRLDVVLAWDDPPTDTIGDAVLNDMDLWLDHGGDCSAPACGELGSTSRKDNVEWAMVRKPTPGTWRIKALPTRLYASAPRAALAWTVIRGNATPRLTLSADKTEVRDGGEVTITLTADGYVAAGTLLHVGCRAPDGVSPCEAAGLVEAQPAREDGLPRSHSGFLGQPIALGEIAPGAAQKVTLEIDSGGEAARFDYTATAWNGKGAATSVAVRTDAVPASAIAQAVAPPNDDFSAAAILDGANGSRGLDLALATTESGEPPLAEGGRPARSVWYRWQTPEDGAASFAVEGGRVVWGTEAQVDIYRGAGIAALETVVSKAQAATFFAERGQTYYIRVSLASVSDSGVTVRWALSGRPGNDNFAAAQTLAGPQGMIAGSNVGATAEPGEAFGALAASVWHRWTAPEDGAWEFSLDDVSASLLVFAGDRISDLRLVAGGPDLWVAGFRARGGETYRILVAARNAFAAGRPFDLSWAPVQLAEDADFLAQAQEIDGGASTVAMSAWERATVEPGEPAATGIRTVWWTWRAPAASRYTWRFERQGEGPFRASAFTRDGGPDAVPSPEALRLVGATAELGGLREFAFDAQAGQRFWIAAGMPTHGYATFARFFANATASWGQTPPNNARASATVLQAAGGSVAGSNRFATWNAGERGAPGHSSLWWRYRAEQSGWVRFWLEEGEDHLLTLHRADGEGGLLQTGRSEYANEDGAGPVELRFKAEVGDDYLIRLASSSYRDGGEFSLRWEVSEPPVWLRYVGRLSEGDATVNGVGLEIGPVFDLTLNPAGDVLYVAADESLSVFERNAGSGALALLQQLPLRHHARIAWDERRGALYGYDFEERALLRFRPGAGARLAVDGRLGLAHGNNDVWQLLLDATGNWLYVTFRRVFEPGGEVLVFAFDEASGELQQRQRLELDVQPGQLSFSADGGHLYLTQEAGAAVVVFQRDADTGELTAGRTIEALGVSGGTAAVSDDGRYLFTAFDSAGARVFSLQNPSNPREVGSLPGWHWRYGACAASVARARRWAFDGFCEGSAFSAEWRPNSNTLAVTDGVGHWRGDRFNDDVSHFDFGGAHRAVASPDGRHAYVATAGLGIGHDIVVFERVGNEAPATGP